MKRVLSYVVLCSALCGAPLAIAAAVPGTVEVQQAATLQQQGALLLDVRNPDEYAEVHAKGARLIPLGQLPYRLKEVAQFKNQPVAVICHSGRRSARAVEILRNAGFTEVANVQGGTVAWVNAGLPVEGK